MVQLGAAKKQVPIPRKELESIMRHVFEQGLVERQIGFEEMFDPSTPALEED